MSMSIISRYLLLLTAMIVMGCSSTPPATPLSNTSTAPFQTQGLLPTYEDDYHRAQTLLQSQSYEKALPLLMEIAAANPGYADVWGNYALALYGVKRYEDADKTIQQALALEPNSAELFDLAGLILVAMGHYKSAENAHIQAIKVKPECASCHYNLALLFDIYYQDLARAITQYQAYLNNIATTDENTQAWVEELQRNLSKKEIK